MNNAIQAYLAENANYLDKNSAAAISGFPESAWAALVQAVSILSGGGTNPGIDCNVAVTSEALADIDAARAQHWSERGARHEHELAGLTAIHFERFQLRRGAARRSQIVVDLGDRRVSLY